MDELLEHYRDDLRRIVRFRLDSRLCGRLDESDVVQEVMLDASKELDRWKEETKSIFACLYQLARVRLARVHRDHLSREKRDVRREEQPFVSDRSAACLAERISGRERSPSEHALENEIKEQVQLALGRLNEIDREVLVMRILEGIPASDVGEILDITADAVNMRQYRALQRIRPLLKQFGT